MDQGFFIAEKLPNGKFGRPIGNEDDAILLFDDLLLAKRLQGIMLDQAENLVVVQANIVIVGEVLE